MNINEYNYNMESIDLLPDVANVLYNERIVQQREEIKRLKEELRQLKEKRVICFESYDEIGYITVYPDSNLYNKSLNNIAQQVLFDFSKNPKYSKFEYSSNSSCSSTSHNINIEIYNVSFEISSLNWSGSICINFVEMKPDCHQPNREYYINHKSYSISKTDNIYYKLVSSNDDFKHPILNHINMVIKIVSR